MPNHEKVRSDCRCPNHSMWNKATWMRQRGYNKRPPDFRVPSCTLENKQCWLWGWHQRNGPTSDFLGRACDAVTFAWRLRQYKRQPNNRLPSCRLHINSLNKPYLNANHEKLRSDCRCPTHSIWNKATWMRQMGYNKRPPDFRVTSCTL